MKYLAIAITLIAVTYGQLAIKYAMSGVGPMPTENPGAMIAFFLKALVNPWVISGLGAAVLAALAWMAALSRFELSTVYPILSLNFVLVPVASMLIFKEPVSITKIAGMALICLGVYIFSRGL